MEERTNPDDVTAGPPAYSRRKVLRMGGTVGLTVAAGGLLAACTDNSAGEEETASAENGNGGGDGAGRRVIFVVHDFNPFFVPVEAGFMRFANAHGWDAQFTGPESQQIAATVEAQSNAIAAEPDAVIFTRIDTSSFDDNIRQALDRGIRVVLSNVASEGYEELGVGFVGQDFIPAGIQAGREVARRAQELTGRSDGLIIVGNFAPGNSALEERAEGTAQGVAQYNEENGTNFETEVLTTSSDGPEATGIIDARWSAGSDDIVGWSMTEFTHEFVGAWAEDRGLVGQFSVGGFDQTQPVLDGIAAGRIDFTLGQNPYAQGYIAAALAQMEMDSGYPARQYDTGTELTDASNIDEVMEREQAWQDAG